MKSERENIYSTNTEPRLLMEYVDEKLQKYINKGVLGYATTVDKDLSASERFELNSIARAILLNNKNVELDIYLQNSQDRGKVVTITKDSVHYSLKDTGDVIEVVVLCKGYALLLKRTQH